MTSGRAAGRWIAALALAACTLVAMPGAACAHGGSRLTQRSVGRYTVVIDAKVVPMGRGAGIDYTTYLTNHAQGTPVSGAGVEVTVREADGHAIGPLRATGRANTYEIVLPLKDPGAWRKQRLTESVSGPLGSVRFAWTPPALRSQWIVSPLLFCSLALACLMFAWGFVRLRRRRPVLAPYSRIVLFAAAIGCVVFALVSPLDPIGDDYLLSAHMLEHTLIADIAPALGMLALRGPLLLFVTPRWLLRAIHRRPTLRTLGTALQHPLGALTCWALAFGLWHIPSFYDAALVHDHLHDLEHLSFVLAGCVVWYQLVNPAGIRAIDVRRRLIVAVGVLALGTILADVMLFARAPIYPSYAAQLDRLWGIGALRDQQLAGLVMTVDQMVTLGVCVALIVVPRLRRASARSDVRPLVPARDPKAGAAA